MKCTELVNHTVTTLNEDSVTDNDLQEIKFEDFGI